MKRPSLTLGVEEEYQVVDPETGKLEKRFIKTGQRGYGEFVEVLSGLSEGETVVLQPAAAAPSADDASRG